MCLGFWRTKGTSTVTFWPAKYWKKKPVCLPNTGELLELCQCSSWCSCWVVVWRFNVCSTVWLSIMPWLWLYIYIFFFKTRVDELLEKHLCWIKFQNSNPQNLESCPKGMRRSKSVGHLKINDTVMLQGSHTRIIILRGSLGLPATTFRGSMGNFKGSSQCTRQVLWTRSHSHHASLWKPWHPLADHHEHHQHISYLWQCTTWSEDCHREW